MCHDTRPEFLTSDVHLGAVSRETEDSFLDFLGYVGAQGRSLFLTGDLFDFWFEYGRVIPGKYFRVLAALSELAQGGLRVALVGGNHDAWGGRFLREEVGIEYYPALLRTEIAGRPALLVHGDGVGGGQPGYRLLKAALRNKLVVQAFRMLHPELGVRIAQLVSTTEQKSVAHESVSRHAQRLEEWAREQLRLDPTLHWVVCGHVHSPVVREVEGGRFYINAGDWLYHNSYVRVLPDQSPTLHRWTGP